MFDEEKKFVKEYLINTDGISSHNVNQPFRNRYEHILRVYTWAKRISKGQKVNSDILLLSALFHDVGYGDAKNDLKNHSLYSEKIWIDYSKNKYNSEVISSVAFNIKHHSDKSLLNKTSTSKELVLLLEADLLDEEGVMAFEWDSLSCGCKNVTSYNDVLERHNKYLNKFLSQKPMKTKVAKRIWRRKQKFAKRYLKEIEYDLKIE